MGFPKIGGQFCRRNALKDGSEPVALPPDELMAGIKVPVRRHGIIFVPRAASGQPLRHAGAIGKIHIEMEEEKTVSGTMALHISRRQPVILLINPGQISFFDSIRGVLRHDRLHGKNVKPRVVHGQHVLRKIEIIFRIGAAQVIVIPATRCYRTLKIGKDPVVRSPPGSVGAHPVMHLPTPVKAKHQTDMIIVKKFLVLLV